MKDVVSEIVNEVIGKKSSEQGSGSGWQKEGKKRFIRIYDPDERILSYLKLYSGGQETIGIWEEEISSFGQIFPLAEAEEKYPNVRFSVLWEKRAGYTLKLSGKKTEADECMDYLEEKYGNRSHILSCTKANGVLRQILKVSGECMAGIDGVSAAQVADCLNPYFRTHKYTDLTLYDMCGKSLLTCRKSEMQEILKLF